MPPTFPGEPRLQGRAALSNPAGRFERTGNARCEDGWWQEPPGDRVATVVQPDRARTLINVNTSPDLPFDASINPYRGCEHGCIYCYARPTHGYAGLSAGIDFETRLFYKVDAGEVLARELARPGYRCRPVTVGASTDPYQPIERELRVTRAVLEVLAATRHPVSLITKGTLVLRDLDLLADLARDDLVTVAVSITTLDDATKRVLEPRTGSGAARLRVVRALADAGVPTSVMVAPVIPAITDHELESILEAAAAAGARRAGYIPVRLPFEVKDLFREWLAAHFPDRAAHVMALIQGLRGGRDNDPRFGTRLRGTGPFADLLAQRFRVACRRFNLDAAGRGLASRTDLFRPPAQDGAQRSFDW